MTISLRRFLLIPVSVSILAVAACSTTNSPHANFSNAPEASRVDSLLQRAAREAKAEGHTTETLALLEQIHQRNPDDAAVATSFAQSLREGNQFDYARKVLTPFTEAEEPYPDAITELAFVELGLGQYKQAELGARRAVELDPSQGRPFLALGTALDAQNYHEQAEVAFRRGIEKWKGDPAPILNNLALNLASQDKLDQALVMLRKAQEISPHRMEIERNIRIISTLKEGADDFIIRQREQQRAAEEAALPAPKPAQKPAVPKSEVSEADVKGKQAPKDKAKTKKAKTEESAPAKDQAERQSKPERRYNFN